MGNADLVQVATIGDNDAPVKADVDDAEYLAEALAVLNARLIGLDVHEVRIHRATSLAYINGDPAFDASGRVVDLAPVR